MQADRITSAAVTEYYDEFCDSRAVRYRVSGNRRIDRAAELVSTYVEPESNVLEIGCGIGILTERIARRLKGGHVWACDISPASIEYAARTVRSKNISFFVGDAVRGFQAIADRIDRAIAVVTMVDVLEHLPRSTHTDLFCSIRRLMGPTSVLVLTYPSPQYQRYLHEFEPERLQIIDEIVELEDLLQAAGRAQLSLRLFSLQDVWRRNQYVHCVLQADASVDRLHHPPPGVLRRVARRVRSGVARRLHAAWARRRDAELRRS